MTPGKRGLSADSPTETPPKEHNYGSELRQKILLSSILNHEPSEHEVVEHPLPDKPQTTKVTAEYSGKLAKAKRSQPTEHAKQLLDLSVHAQLPEDIRNETIKQICGRDQKVIQFSNKVQTRNRRQYLQHKSLV